MMRKAVRAALASAVLAGGGLLAAPATATASPYCEPGWEHVNDTVTESVSPWFGTTPLPDGGRRSIQFKALGGTIERYQYSNCHYGPERTFITAGQSRYKTQYDFIGPWGELDSPPRWHRWPDQCAGWDFIADRWRPWTGPGC